MMYAKKQAEIHYKDVRFGVIVVSYMIYAYYSNLLDAAGAILLRMSLIKYSGSALTAMMTATFQAKRVDTTKSGSARYEVIRQTNDTNEDVNTHRNTPVRRPC